MTTLLPFASDYMEGAYTGQSQCTRPLTVYFFAACVLFHRLYAIS